MVRLSTMTLISWLALVVPVLPCELVGSRSHEQLVSAATVIVRARAEGLGDGQGPQGVFALATRVRFRVLAVYKGVLESERLEFNGELQSATKPDRPTSYDFKRARSFTPSCFNPSYLSGAEYLLLLGPDNGIYSRAGELTPYWGPQQPTNERVIGERDPWLLWVLRAVGQPLPN
jgi:hypothetical protein